jgi:hypothetical protein
MGRKREKGIVEILAMLPWPRGYAWLQPVLDYVLPNWMLPTGSSAISQWRCSSPVAKGPDVRLPVPDASARGVLQHFAATQLA